MIKQILVYKKSQHIAINYINVQKNFMKTRINYYYNLHNRIVDGTPYSKFLTLTIFLDKQVRKSVIRN